MLNTSIEKGIIIGESPYRITETIDSSGNISVQTQQNQPTIFVLYERSEAGTQFVAPTMTN